MSDYSEIDPCLVQAFIAAIPDAETSTKFENGPVIDVAGKPLWYELTNFQNPADPVGLGANGDDELTGVFQINIYVALNTSTKATNTAIKLLNLFFAIGKSISYGSTVLKINRCGKSGSSGESQGMFRSTVSVYWTTRINRSI